MKIQFLPLTEVADYIRRFLRQNILAAGAKGRLPDNLFRLKTIASHLQRQVNLERCTCPTPRQASAATAHQHLWRQVGQLAQNTTLIFTRTGAFRHTAGSLSVMATALIPGVLKGSTG